MPNSPIKYVLNEEVQRTVDALVKQAVEEEGPRIREPWIAQGKTPEQAEASVRQFQQKVKAELEKIAIEASKRVLGLTTEVPSFTGGKPKV